jgi:hypothetical protein
MGGVMKLGVNQTGAELAIAEDGEAMIERLGALPKAPLAMPKQRLEARPRSAVRRFLRLAGLARLADAAPWRNDR